MNAKAPSKPPQDKWKFDKTVTAGQLITLASILGSVLLFIHKMDVRINLLEQAQIVSNEDRKAIKAQVKEMQANMNDNFMLMNKRLDNRGQR